MSENDVFHIGVHVVHKTLYSCVEIFKLNLGWILTPFSYGIFTGVEKPKDDVRRANEVLCAECAKAQEEYKRLKGVVDQLNREYEDSKVREVEVKGIKLHCIFIT